MITVKLINGNRVHPVRLAQHAANECYSSENPEYGPGFKSKLNPERALWRSGHHTTFQHAAHYFTFQIEGLAISEVTFGLHLTTPFYNTSQRSGRFCGEMFKNPDFAEMEKYIRILWPEVEDIGAIMDYIRLGFAAYNRNFAGMEKFAAREIAAARPRAVNSYVVANAYKFAQEQSRIFLPTIFPTGLVYTVNLPTLAGLYRTAWLPGMTEAVSQMARLVSTKYPDLAFMFSRDNATVDRGSPCSRMLSDMDRPRKPAPLFRPRADLLALSAGEPVVPTGAEVHPLNLLTVDPRFMDNNLWQIRSDVVISLITMGQDQRHRTIKRTLPRFAGTFYVPPLVKKLDLSREMREIFETWRGFHGRIPDDLLVCLAPYGAMVRYEKTADGNAFIHETGKRLCWCAQEEIYHLNRELRDRMMTAPSTTPELKEKLHLILSPNCVKTGRCGEGAKRYCGRDLSRIATDPFPKRVV